MANTFGIRILDKKDNILKFKLFLITSDFNYLPRTHGFGYLMLTSTDHKKAPSFLDDALNPDNFALSVYDNGRKYIKRLEISEFNNYPISPSFREKSLYELNEKTGEFENETILPNGIYTMAVSDSTVIDHINAGDVWETPHADMWFASFYLENEKDQKFYHLYQNDSGIWCTHQGKTGSPGKHETIFMVDEEAAERTIQPKMRKSQGYRLIYKNFDTPFKLEDKFKSKNDQILHEKLLEIMSRNDIELLSSFIEQNIEENAYSGEFVLTLFDDYKKTIKENKKKVNWKFYPLLSSKAIAED